ncbi:unnamed protein product [Auanema sp. JU1783]|nr:unnamed protein product [Auanema sp. JU1783]
MSSTVSKSYNSGADPIVKYCSEHTCKLHPLQIELQNHTLRHVEMSQMLGAPEVLTVGHNFIQLIGAKKCLDIGTYTGASALAWALALGNDGKVFTFDLDLKNYKEHGLKIIQKAPEVQKKITAVEGAALKSLDDLIANGASGTFDFAFIDADKRNYTNYYDRCVTLLRTGGVILVDNSLWGGIVATGYSKEDTTSAAIDETNNKIFKDTKTNSALLNCGDGLHIAFKK